MFLNNNIIGDAGVKHIFDSLAKNDSIRILYLHANQIGVDGAKHIGVYLAQNKPILWVCRFG